MMKTLLVCLLACALATSEFKNRLVDSRVAERNWKLDRSSGLKRRDHAPIHVYDLGGSFDEPIFAGDIAFVRTSAGKLWRYDSSWNSLSLTLVGGVQVSEKDPTRILIFQENSNVYWTSIDGGASTTAHQSDAYWFEDPQRGIAAEFNLHPSESNSVLGITYRAGCRDNFPGTSAWMSSCATDLVYSQDFGSSWTNVGTWPMKSSWGWAGQYNIPTTAVFYLHAQSESWTLWGGYYTMIDGKVPLVRSDVVQSSKLTKVTNDTADFLFLGDWLFTLDFPEDYLQTYDLYLMVGSGGCSPKVSKLPIQLSALGTTIHILDATPISLILGAIVYVNSYEFGDILLSDPIGTTYSLILDDVMLSGTSWSTYEFQWHRVSGLDGVFIANQATGGDSNVVKTKITYDMGATWHYLTAPSGSCTGSAECHLHLSMDIDGGVYSFAEYPGLIVALGMTGAQLSTTTTPNVFISWDAGVTWQKTSLTGRYMAEWAGALVLVPTGRGSIVYTLDEGLTFNTFETSGDILGVSEITTHPTQSRLLVEATITAGIRLLDISLEELASPCSFPADYEQWSPLDPYGNCIKNHIHRYSRKVPGRSCLDEGQYRAAAVCDCMLTECSETSAPFPVWSTCDNGVSSSSSSPSSFKAIYIVIPLLVLLLLGAAGAGGYFFWKKKKDQQRPTPPDWDRLADLDTDE